MFNPHKVRMNRLFGESGRCLDVAIDHGAFNEASFLAGLEDIEKVVRLLVEAGPDAIQMNYGQADVLQNIAMPDKPALVMRTDAGNPYSAPPQRPMFDMLVCDIDPVLPAVKLDAACVVCNLLYLPGEPDLHRQTVKNISRLRHFCDKYAMPLMVEPLVMKVDGRKGGRLSRGDKRLLVPLVRQARELGADVVKADPTDNTGDYHEVIQAARCPVLGRGGGKERIDSVFRKAEALLQQGAAGLVYGRNVYQHANPSKVVRALWAMIHKGASAQSAMEIYQKP